MLASSSSAFTYACFAVALSSLAWRFTESTVSDLALDSELGLRQRLQLGGLVDDAVNQVLSSTSSPEELLKLLADGRNQSGPDDNKQCLEDLDRWKKALNNSELWALQMADSASKFVTGILFGQNADLGDFDECVEATPGTLGTNDDFTGLYGLPTLTLYTRVNSPLSGTSLEESSASAFSKKLVSLRFAVCAPSTCNVEYLQSALTNLTNLLNPFSKQKELYVDIDFTKERTSLYSGYRQPNNKDWAIVGLTVFFAAVVVIATAIDLALGSNRLTAEQGWCSKVVIAFSASRNGKKLLAVGPSGGDTMSCIHGIRVLSMLWIVQGHRWSWSIEVVPYTNANSILTYVYGNYAFIILVADALLSVDTYFVIGGIVNTYVFMKTVRKTNRFNIFQYYIHRYLRLTPAFMFVLGVAATWFSLLGNGPLWYWINETSVGCQRSWWTNLVYVANYVQVQNQCFVLWYPNTDMQLFWLSPLALIPLWKRPRLGVIWLLFIILVSCVVPLVISLANDYRFIAPVLADFGSKPLWRDEYWAAHMRATPYFVGLFVGYLLYLFKIEKRSFVLNRFQTCLVWLAVTVICMAVMIPVSPLFDTKDYVYNKLASGFYIAFARLGWSIVVSWVVVACVTGHGGPVNAFLSWSPFAVIGRLTYGIYLVHNLVQQVDFGSYRAAEYFSPYKMSHRTVSDFMIATFLAAVLSLMLESPIILLEKWMWEGKKTEEGPKKKGELP